MSFIGIDNESYRSYIVEKLIDGVGDSDRQVVTSSFDMMIGYYDKKYYSKEVKRKIKELFKKQLEMFYVLNTFINSKNKEEVNEAWQVYQKKSHIL